MAKINMYAMRNIGHIRKVFLAAVRMVGIDTMIAEKRDDGEYCRDGKDVYVVAPKAWEAAIKQVTESEDVDSWLYVFKRLKWLKTEENRYKVKKLVNGKQQYVIAVDKQMLRLLKELKPIKKMDT